MMIEKFWVVIEPRELSELDDICFESDIKNMALQYKGGLDPEEIVAVFFTRAEAVQIAELLLKRLGGKR